MKVYVIGVGPGTEDYLLPIARRNIEESDCLVGAKRLISLFRYLGKEEFATDGRLKEALSYIMKHRAREKIAVLVSGDPGIHSFLGMISAVLKPEEFVVIPGISALQLAFAKIGESWHDAKVLSLHGRKAYNLTGDVKANDKVFIFTDSSFPPARIAAKLLKDGLENRRAVVLERLSYPDEKIIDTDLKRLGRMGRPFGLSAMIIERIEKRSPKGKLYGLGIGPGEPGLVTLKAKNILDRVRTVFVPKSSDDAISLARTIVEAVTEGQKNFVELTFPMTKDRAILNKCWRKAAGMISREVARSRDAAFVTIGDPFIYSTYVYLLKTLNDNFPNIEVRTVPGISAFNAAASAAGLPLVEADERLAIVPVGDDLRDLRKILEEFDTVVLMKVGSRLAEVLKLLKELRLLKKAVLVSRVGHKGEKITRDLTSMHDKKAGYLSVMIVKKGRMEKA